MENVKLSSMNGVSTITFNRPERYNALDAETLEQFLTVIEQAEKNEDNMLIMTGEGKSFCAGGDVKMMAEMEGEESFEKYMDTVEAIVMKLYLMPKIVIAAVNGSAVGLGMSIALNSDYIIAHKDAKFGMLFAGIGLIPDGGGHFFLKERLGTHHAKQFIWSLQQVEGEKAKKFGFVDELVDQDAREATSQIITKLQASPMKAIIETKMILHHKQKEELLDYLQVEKQSQAKMGRTEDHREGVQAFIEKRFPVFKGK